MIYDTTAWLVAWDFLSHQWVFRLYPCKNYNRCLMDKPARAEYQKQKEPSSNQYLAPGLTQTDILVAEIRKNENAVVVWWSGEA